MKENRGRKWEVRSTKLEVRNMKWEDFKPCTLYL
jgi:hypothetical protein